MIFGYDISRTWVSNLVRSDFGYHHLGQPQAQKGVGKWSPEALACTPGVSNESIYFALISQMAFWYILNLY